MPNVRTSSGIRQLTRADKTLHHRCPLPGPVVFAQDESRPGFSPYFDYPPTSNFCKSAVDSFATQRFLDENQRRKEPRDSHS